MSILLDALKKSEAQRRLGEVPTLQTNVSADDGRHADRQHWIPLALILLSAGIMSWTGMTQFRVDDSLPASPERKSGSPAVTGTEEAIPAPVVVEEPKGRSTRTRAQTRNAATTPVKDYVVDKPAPVSQAHPSTNGDVVVSTNRQSPDSPVASPDVSGRQTDNGLSRRLAHVEVEANTPAEAGNNADPSAGNTAAAAGQPMVTDQGTYAPLSISYWQVPQSLREEMGGFRISVLVYAENPADRFLLVNGRRLREQEKTDGGVLLEVIERDRAVFSYRNYRFHLKN